MGGIGSGLTGAGGTTFLAVPTPSALANGRSVATQTYRASKGGVAAFCTRYAREVVSRQP